MGRKLKSRRINGLIGLCPTGFNHLCSCYMNKPQLLSLSMRITLAGRKRSCKMSSRTFSPLKRLISSSPYPLVLLGEKTNKFGTTLRMAYLLFRVLIIFINLFWLEVREDHPKDLGNKEHGSLFSG